jgi:predicted RNase H-like nuclease (RuvC/YqgF family)
MKYRPPKFNKMDREIQWEIYNVLRDFSEANEIIERTDLEKAKEEIYHLLKYLQAQEDDLDRLEEIAEEARKVLTGDNVAITVLDKLLWERGL